MAEQQRDKLEHICRYVSRSAVSEKRLSLTANGQIRYELKTSYRNGITHIILLNKLGLDSEAWIELTQTFGQHNPVAVGSVEDLALFAKHTGKHWIAGKTARQRILH